MSRKRYDVVPATEGWALTHQNATISTHEIKTTAIGAGVVQALLNKPSQLIIHRQDGTIEDERTYGDDPFPPRG